MLLLGEEEKRDPLLFLERFFSDYRLHECRLYLWMMVETCITTDNTAFSDPEERANLLLRYKDLERLLEAGYLIWLQRMPGAGGTGGERDAASGRA